MHSFLRQATASQSRSLGPFLDDTDFKTPETGLTIANTDIKLLINGAASANKNSGGGTHRANGVYGVTFDATDTATVGEIFVSVGVSGALPVFATFVVLEEAIYDALFAASATGLLPANVTQFGGVNGTFSGGRPEVNTTHAAGTAWGSGAITAGSFAQGAADKVWSTTTRLLTAGTNIVLAKGTGLTGLNDLSAANVNAEVVDALNVDTYPEPGQGAPPSTASLVAKIGYLMKAWRNRSTQTASQYSLYADDGTTVDQKATFSDNGTTADRGEVVTGP